MKREERVIQLVKLVVDNVRNIKNGTTDSNVEVSPQHHLHRNFHLDDIELVALTLLISEEYHVYVSAQQLAEMSVKDLQNYVTNKSKTPL